MVDEDLSQGYSVFEHVQHAKFDICKLNIPFYLAIKENEFGWMSSIYTLHNRIKSMLICNLILLSANLGKKCIVGMKSK